MEYSEIESLFLANDRNPIKAKFFDGLFIYVIRLIPEQKKLIGKHLLCAKNARQYVVSPVDIESVVVTGKSNTDA